MWKPLRNYGNMIRNVFRKGVNRMRVYGQIATGVAAAALLGMINLGCAAKQPPPAETVPRIWQSAGNDDAHGVIEIGAAHLLVNINRAYGSDFQMKPPNYWPPCNKR